MDEGWAPTLPDAELPDARLTRVDVDGAPVLLYRNGDRVFAVAGRCTHAGMPLDRGPIAISGSEATITCPAHGSRFRLDDGRVIRPPAREPLASFEVRIVDDVIELRART